MSMTFTKMHGCGNSYVYFNCFENEISDVEKLSIRLSDQHFGIGSDGVILICPSDVAHAKMRIFNADGSEGKMCGNGIRCVGKYLYDSGIAKFDIIEVETLSGVKTLEMMVQDGVAVGAKVDMGAAILKPSDIPVTSDAEVIINQEILVDGNTYNITCVSMGNPHCVIFCEQDIDTLDLEKIGPMFENNELFPERINTEFVNIIGENELKMRVWERGSGETWACGTGSCAVGVAACLNGHCNKNEQITIHLRGGDLMIEYTDETVFMTGSAEIICNGSIEE